MSTNPVNSDEKSSVLHDVLFFVKGIPNEVRVRSEEMVVASIGGIGPKIVEKLGELNLAFDYFRRNRPDLELSVFLYRGCHPNPNEAIKTAHSRLEGILDVCAQLLDHNVEVSKITLSRPVGQSEVQIYEFHQGGYAYLKKSVTTGEGQWRARNNLVLINLLKHLDYLSGHPNIPTSELREDLVYALRMYRHGAKSEIFGLEFLAKFSALECLVCGSAISKKAELLRENLSRLFDGDSVITEDLIQRLWLLRCEGSHRARVSADRSDREAMPASVATMYLDHIFACVLYFALEHSSQCQTVEDLWTRVSGYVLPELISTGRPKGVTRTAVESLVVDANRALKDIGPLFDACLGANLEKSKSDKLLRTKSSFRNSRSPKEEKRQ